MFYPATPNRNIPCCHQYSELAWSLLYIHDVEQQIPLKVCSNIEVTKHLTNIFILITLTSFVQVPYSVIASCLHSTAWETNFLLSIFPYGMTWLSSKWSLKLQTFQFYAGLISWKMSVKLSWNNRNFLSNILFHFS